MVFTNTIRWSYFRNVVCRGEEVNGAWRKNSCIFWVSRHAAFIISGMWCAEVKKWSVKKQLLHVLIIQHFCVSLHAALIINHVCDRLMYSHYSNALKIRVFSTMSTVGSNLLLLLHPLFRKASPNTVSLNFYSKFLDVLFTFPVQVFEDERIEETYRLWYFEAEKAYLRRLNFLVRIVKSLVWSFSEETVKER